MKTVMKAKLLGAMVLAAALASGCGGIDTIDSHESNLAINELEMAPPSLISGDIPGCNASNTSGQVTLLRHPFSDGLVVVVRNGLPSCIDSPRAVEQFVAAQTTMHCHSAQDSQHGGQNQGQEGNGSGGGGDDDPPADDPIPIKGSGNTQSNGGQKTAATGDDVSDDPLPILEQQTAASRAR